jgi:hypothetical protein
MELDLESLFGLLVHCCTHWLRPRNTPPPPAFGSYMRALLISQDRQHLFVTPWKIQTDKEVHWLPLDRGGKGEGGDN